MQGSAPQVSRSLRARTSRAGGELRVTAALHRGSTVPKLTQQHHDAVVLSRSAATHRPVAVASASSTLEQPLASSSGRQTYVTREARKALFGKAKEQVSEVEAAVQGTIPAWLSGSLLLNGGGDYSGMSHMFDGFAMVSKLRLQGGRVFGAQRYVQSLAYKHFVEKGRLRWREFGTAPPASSPLDTAFAAVDMLTALAVGAQSTTDNASVNIVPLADGTVMALSESLPSTYRIDPSTLATIGPVKFSDAVPGNLSTAHPRPLPDGRLVNFTRSVPVGGFHVFVQDPATLARKEVAFISDRRAGSPAWVHDLAVTERYAVICESPLYFNLPALTFNFETEHIFMDWRPEDGSRVHLVALDGSGVRTFTAPTFFSFHVANAYEEADGSAVHMDFSVYKDAEIVNQLNLAPIMKYPGGEVADSWLRRLTLPLSGPPSASAGELPFPQRVTADEAAYGRFCEFPTVSGAVRGRKHRYVYATGAVRPTHLGNALVKHDVQAGTSKLWHEEGAMPGEPAFVAAPNGSAEDEGVVLSAVMGADGRSFLLVLDAATWQELGRAVLPFTVPYRFHGAFVPDRQ